MASVENQPGKREARKSTSLRRASGLVLNEFPFRDLELEPNLEPLNEL
jgi:hypothetical protein